MAEENKKFLTISHLKQLLSSLKQRFTAIENQLERKSNISDLAEVATTGSYNDLIDKPSGANWNASEGEDGYIKNKPFYKEISSQIMIVEEQTVSIIYKGRYGEVKLTPVNGFEGLIDGEIITATIDGDKYSSTVVKENDDYYWAEFDNHSGIDYDGSGLYYRTDILQKNSITISISRNVVYTYHKLDSNYIDTENTIATHTYVNEALATKANSADLATVATTGNYGDLSNKPIIPTVPTNVSSFTNDAGYLTSHQSLTGYATEQWVGQQGYLTNYTETDPTVPAWAKASTKPSYTASEVGALPNTTVIPTKTSDLTNDNGFVTQEDVKEQILSDDYTEEKVPYLYREAPYSVASVEEKIVGGTVGWNQIVNYPDPVVLVRSSLRTKGISFNEGTTIVKGHVYFISYDLSNCENLTKLCTFRFYARKDSQNKQLFEASAMTDQRIQNLFKSDEDAISTGNTSATDNNMWLYMYVNNSESDDATATIKNIQIADLTQMFGSTIADYIYSLEQSTAGAGVSKLKEWGFFNEDYYEYCEPTLKSVEGLTEKKTVGFNQWDEEWEQGSISNVDGTDASSTVRFRTKNHIRVVQGATYYLKSTDTVGFRWYDASKNFLSASVPTINSTFTVPNNACFLRFVDTTKAIYSNDICINLSDPARNGQYEPYESHTYSLDSSVVLRGVPKLDSNNQLYFDGDTYESDGTVRRRFTERAYQSGDESLADAITDGTTTVVKLATPTTETAPPYHNPQIVGDTEEFVTTGLVPVGHETKCYAGTMNLINSKADKATTYTKTEVDTALSAKAGTAVATTSANGLMSSTDKGRLDDLYADYSSALTALGVN